jgi:hypothetical protein
VAQHVRVRLHFKAGGNRRPLDHPGKASGRERGSPLADEDNKRRRLALPLEPAQGPEFVAAQGVGAATSSGCIRLTNDDVIDLYNRVYIGTTVVVLR